VIAGVTIPGSSLAAEATELVRDAAPDLLFHHCAGYFLFGSLHGSRLGPTVDPVSGCRHIGVAGVIRDSDWKD
jgi:hypothetical protein